MFTSDTGKSRKGIFSLVHDSEKTQVPVLDRALAKIRSMYSGEDSEGNLSEDCQEIYSNTDCRRLTITKKSVQREDWRVVARQSVPLTHFHCITCFR